MSSSIHLPVAWIAVAFLAIPASGDGMITVGGTVMGPFGPVVGAMVDLMDQDRIIVSMPTDDQGEFSAQVPRKTRVSVSVQPPLSSGLHPRTVWAIDSIEEDLTLRIQLARTVRLSGTVRTASGQPVPVRVVLYSLTRAADNADSGRQSPLSEMESAGGSFFFEVPADFYSIHARAAGTGFLYGRKNVDASHDLSDLEIILTSDPSLMPERAPRSDLVSVSRPDANFVASIEGRPGATEPLSTVMALNARTSQANLTVSSADGSFSLPLFLPEGSMLLLSHDSSGQYLSIRPDNKYGSPTAVIPTPAEPGTFTTCSTIDFARGVEGTWNSFPVFGGHDPGQWVLEGSMPSQSWSPGQTLHLQGKLTILSRNLEDDLSQLRVSGDLVFTKLFDEEGRQRISEKTFASDEMTPTGLPILRQTRPLTLGSFQFTNLRLAGPARAEADWSIAVTLPATLTGGIYEAAARIHITGISKNIRRHDVYMTSAGSRTTQNATLPLIRVGEPRTPRLQWALFVNDPSNGDRGVLGRGLRSESQIANGVLISGERYGIPMTDRRGNPIRYRLEPFLPLNSGLDRARDLSRVPFRFPSGTLRVVVIDPDGAVTDLGSAPFVELTNRFPHTRSNLVPSLQSAAFPSMDELGTRDPRFEVTFSKSGRHEIVLSGTVEDPWGNVYEGGGTFDVDVGQLLDIETGVVPGTPFEVGDAFSPVVILQPAVAADVEIRSSLVTGSNPESQIEQVIRGRSNRFGYFAPGEVIRFLEPGEYRVDITVSHVDGHDVQWSGSMTWGSIVESPGMNVVTHGRRGFEGNPEIGEQWFFFDQAAYVGDHVMFPFHRGDIAWMEDLTGPNLAAPAETPPVTFDDREGGLAESLRRHWRDHRPPIASPDLEQRIRAGEAPLFSTPWGTDEAVTQWGYSYAFAERPGVRVREFISADAFGPGYWRFRDSYHGQPGNGIEGDRVNDFKFQFGGAVYREPSEGISFFGAYASLFVLIPEDDEIGGRIFPPFQGNGGGPSGGPLLELKGREIDIFFHPTGVRPGTILVRGNLASFSGQIGPTLPSKVQITITSPSGKVRPIEGQANKIGYFYDPAHDFRVMEAGVWTAGVRVWHDGLTSAGQVTEPYPTGDVLGSREGEFFFYVVEPSSKSLEVDVSSITLTESPSGVRFVRPADGPVTFTIAPPEDLTDATFHYTVTMPGFILEDATLSSPLASRLSPLSYTYDAQQLAQHFPNLDLHDADGFAGVDTITLSFVVSGRDGSGAMQHFARQIVLQGEELQMPEQEPASPRRRGVRR